MVTSAGNIEFKPNLFLRPRGRARAIGITNAPGAPTVGAVGAATNPVGSLTAGDSYDYVVTAVNDHGEGSISAVQAATVQANGSAQIQITAVAGAKYYKVYRKVTGAAAGSEAFIGNYRSAGDITDSGAKGAGLGEAFLLDMSSEVMRFKQLSPLSKINFAIVTTALEFAVVLYGALFVYAPRFNCLFRNIGK